MVDSSGLKLQKTVRLQLLDGDRGVGVNADFTRDRQRLLDDAAGVQFRVLQQGSSRRLAIGAAGTDRQDIVFGLDHVAGARDQQRLGGVGNHQQRFQAPQHPVGTPILGQLDGRPGQVAVLIEFPLEEFEQGKGVGRAARKPRQHLVVMQAPQLAGVALHDLVAQADLAVAAHGDPPVTTDTDDGCRVLILHFLHRLTPSGSPVAKGPLHGSEGRLAEDG